MSQSKRKSAEFNRREFLGSSARNAAGMAAGVLSLGMAPRGSANESLSIGVIGLGAQGRELAQGLCVLPDVRVVAVCDVDARNLAAAQHELSDQSGTCPIAYAEYERVLERPDIDAVVIATPDHWHAKISSDACLAGKDLYIEQPVTHSIDDGERLRTVAENSGRIVQTGLPQRSGAHFQSAVELLRSGEIGRVHLARAWAVHRRRSIGKAAAGAAPQGVDFARWLGPAEFCPFQLNRFHQNWPWFWDYGSGELGLWGVQLLDVVRWGLNLDLPTRVAASGGRRYFHDDRETPDTLTVQFEFPDVDVVWEHRQWSSRGIEGRTAAAAFYGERGTLIVDRSGWKVYDGREGLYADAGDIRRSHLENWIACIRSRRTPAAGLDIGLKSMAVCHLGNIAYRLGREIRFDPQAMSCCADAQANALLAVHSRSPWQLAEG